ncbi:hypothetical protein IF650_09520 [Cellulosimicrobium terreum]|nr:hypothetical protein [Cellulosimicrobium terreum]
MPTTAIRITLHPATDVLLEPGVRLGDARAELARLTCRPELVTAPLRVEGVVVDDEHRCGTHPLLPGATLVPGPQRDPATRRPATGRPGPFRAVLASPWHVAVLTGPDAGRLVPVGDGTRGAAPVDGLRVGWHHGRAGARVRVAVPAGSVRRRPGRRARRVRVPWPVRWRPGVELVSGATAYALRRRPTLELDPASADGTGVAPRDGHGIASHLPMALVPAAGSVVLAVTMRQPLYALVALASPLALLVPALLRVRRRRAALSGSGSRGRHDGPTDGGAPTGPHDESSDGQRSDGPRSGVRPGSVPAPDPLRPRPADLATRAVVAHHAPAVERPAAERPRSLLGSTDEHPLAPVAPPLPDGCAAVVGPPGAALAVARAVVAELLAGGATPVVRCAPDHEADWSWCRWVPGARVVTTLDEVEAADVLVVDARGATRSTPGTPGTAELAAAWPRLAARGTRLLLLAARTDDVPAWCRTVLHTDGSTTYRTGADGARTAQPHVAVHEGWLDTVARHLAAAHHRGHVGRRARRDDAALPGQDTCDPAAPGIPAAVSLAAVAGAPADAGDLAGWLGDRWATPRDPRSLSVPLGVDADGTVVRLDLVAQGPHLLVAGTTGAGKSELLQTLVTGIALTCPPAEVTLALVDFKGGTSFGACGDLPHVAGRVTDLDQGLAGRALAGLRAELHRRERVLAGAGVTDLADLPVGTLPRLVVVIDEFRALADDLPEFLPGLLRVAAQGRALGVHLVLATQRPAGAVSTDVRANISTRIALRIVDPADSADVVDTPQAARIPADAPGRAVLRHGNAPPVALQCARASTPVRATRSGTRLAPAWGAPRPGPGPFVAPALSPGDSPGVEPVVVDALPALVAAAREVAADLGAPRPRAPWLPALPERIDLDELARAGTGHGLAFALGDMVAEQRHEVLHWDPADGHLAVVGRARSGRTTALHTLACAALATGWHVHVVGSDPDLRDLAGRPGVGTVVDRSDPRRVARLLRLLAGYDDAQGRPSARGPGGSRRTLVVVDDVEAVHAALSWLPGGVGVDVLGAALAGSGGTGGSGPCFALSGSGHHLSGLGSQVGVRVVLSSRDRHDDVTLGVPAALAGHGGPPGRAVRTGAGEPVVCQVAVAAPTPVEELQVEDLPAAGSAPLRVVGVPGTVLVDEIEELPDDAADRTGDGPGSQPWAPGPATVVPVGRGGDHGGVLSLDVSDGALVVGPAGSGRSATLRLVTGHLAARGVLAGVVSRDATVRAAAGEDVASLARFVPADLSGFLDAVERRTVDDVRPVLVVDDLDQLGQLCVLESDRLAGLCREDLRLVASSTTTGAAMALRGPLAELRAARAGVVLGPGERGSGDVFGHALEWLTEPGRPRAGRGVLVQGSRLAPLQVALAEPAVRAVSPWVGSPVSSPRRQA